MVYVLELDGKEKLKIQFPKRINEEQWVIEEDELDTLDTTTHTFDDEEQALFFMETRIEELKEYGYTVNLESKLTDD